MPLRRLSRQLLLLGVLAGSVVMASGCVDEMVVYRDRPLVDDVPAESQGFIGYSDTGLKITVCGNCHVGRQADWEETAHAGAWATLAGSGSAQGFCQACHTVSSRGNNATEENVGWVSTENARFHDVQCESCHGPGLDHVTTPDAPGNQPLAFIGLGPGVDQGCAQCHSGVHRPFAEEWAESGHGNLRPSQANNPSCARCHEGKAALTSWGMKSEFSPQDMGGPLAITCAVCHDPHDARNDGQLRFSISTPVLEDNLCMRCHLKRGGPEPGSFRGPHSPQGPLLVGEAGWWPPNLEYAPGDIVGTHGGEANPRLCAGCHVNDYRLTDEDGGFEFRTTGHSFAAIPCVDGEGVPTEAATCGLTDRSFQSCTDGCHGTEQAARSALIVARDRLNDLSDVLEGLLDQVPESEFAQAGRYTTADGSLFNLQLGRIAGSAIHNPFLTEALLRASIRQVGIDYGVTPGASHISLEPQLTRPERAQPESGRVQLGGE